MGVICSLSFTFFFPDGSEPLLSFERSLFIYVSIVLYCLMNKLCDLLRFISCLMSELDNLTKQKLCNLLCGFCSVSFNFFPDGRELCFRWIVLCSFIFLLFNKLCSLLRFLSCLVNYNFRLNLTY